MIRNKPKKYTLTLQRFQGGAALLTLMLIIVVGSAYYLTAKLNTNLIIVDNNVDTRIALLSAKEALIGFAASFPDRDISGAIDGPGYLPCPDLNKDNSAAANCSAGGNTLIGRLPNQTLGLEELKDASGQRLWYALSENFRYGSEKIIPLNSESPANAALTLDAVNTDIVAIILAPGEPLDGQNRDPSEANILLEIANYLEDENSDFDGGGDLDSDFVSTSNGDFNDQVIVITRQELMQAVEKRVLGEARQFLTAYFNNQTAYPWLTIFSDPKSLERRLTGTHTGSDDQVNLTDSSVDFTQWGVADDDVIWNITDGSYGYVTDVVSTNTLEINNGLGMNLSGDDFDADDEYYIDVSAYSNAFTGTATTTAGSSGLVLEDTNINFETLGIKNGDVVEIVSDGSSGVISDVSTTELTVLSLNGATTTFSNGINYRIRTSQGRVTAAGAMILTDTNVDFTVMGIQVGDLVHNITDGSFARVNTISANTLTVDALTLGVNNTFSIGDYYVLPRYNNTTNAREGLLSFHETGELFQTGFDIDWSVNASVITNSGLSTEPTYNSGLEFWTRTSTGNSGTISINDTDAQCKWINISIADCKGYISDTTLLTGRAGVGSSGLTLFDSNYDFSTIGIKRGDIVENITDGTTGIIYNINISTLTLVDINDGNPSIDFSQGEGYRIHIGTSRIDFLAASPSTSHATRVYYPSIDLTGVEIGDTVENRNGSDSIGTIVSFGSDGSGNYIEHTVLEGSGYADIYTNEAVRIIHNRIDRRDYEFNARFNGSSNVYVDVASEIRKRDICLGYGADCTSAASDTALPGDGQIQLITITDFDSSNLEVGSANALIPTAGVQGSIKLSNVDTLLSESYDTIPSWFIENNWHQLIYISYDGGDSPGGGADCIPLTTDALSTNPCLTLTGAGAPNDNQRALVISSGSPLSAQDRTTGLIGDFYENQNASSGDDDYQTGEITTTFNDQVQIIDTAP